MHAHAHVQSVLLSPRRLRYITLQTSEHVLALFHLAGSPPSSFLILLLSPFITTHICERSRPNLEGNFMNEH